MKKEVLSSIMRLAWQFVRKNGYTMSEALKAAWANVKLKVKMQKGIVKFYFRKVDGSRREAWGTLAEKYLPVMDGEKKERAKNDFTQIYFDTEKQEFRSYKKVNLIY